MRRYESSYRCCTGAGSITHASCHPSSVQEGTSLFGLPAACVSCMHWNGRRGSNKAHTSTCAYSVCLKAEVPLLSLKRGTGHPLIMTMAYNEEDPC